ncbi:hypothetical protein [Persephonella sp.]
MKRFIFYILLFIVSFILAFVYTFPADRFAGYLLSKNGIGYSYIEGNIFHIKVKDVSTGNIYIKNIDIKNNFPKLNVGINNSYIGSINLLTKSFLLNLKDFELSSVQKKPGIYGKISAKHNVKINNQILINGKGSLYISKIQKFPVNNVNINYFVKDDDEKNKIEADIKGKLINGRFTGELYLPLEIKKGYIKGQFNGKIFNGNISRKIFLNFSQLNL